VGIVVYLAVCRALRLEELMFLKTIVGEKVGTKRELKID
jgi:hypothetical protein